MWITMEQRQTGTALVDERRSTKSPISCKLTELEVPSLSRPEFTPSLLPQCLISGTRFFRHPCFARNPTPPTLSG
jgi:hypothetical protein